MSEQFRKIEMHDHMAGGLGSVTIRHILNERELNGKCRLYAQVTLKPGCSIGEHPQHGETETYYLLSDGKMLTRPMVFTPASDGSLN